MPGGALAAPEQGEGDAVPARAPASDRARRGACEGGRETPRATRHGRALREDPDLQLSGRARHRSPHQAHVAPARRRPRGWRVARRVHRRAPRGRARGAARRRRRLMRPTQVARRGADYLRRHGVDEPQAAAESEVLLQRVLGVNRAELFTRDAGLTTAEAKAYGRALCRRCAGTPLQHLTRQQGFRRLILEVRPGVFVPRPETEVLVDVVLQTLEPIETPIVADQCTGSGAVALAVADEHPGAQVYATDVSDDAVALARANAIRLGLAIDVERGDLFGPLPSRLKGRIDAVSANPPYVPDARRQT